MTQRVELPDGQWAEIRGRQELTERQRRFIVEPRDRLNMLPGIRELYAAIPGEGLSDAEFYELCMKVGIDPVFFKRLTQDVNDRRIVGSLVAWSFAAPVRLDQETIDAVIDLPPVTYDALNNAVFGVERGVDFSPTPDPDSPTVPSPDSDEA